MRYTAEYTIPRVTERAIGKEEIYKLVYKACGVPSHYVDDLLDISENLYSSITLNECGITLEARREGDYNSKVDS